MAESLHTILRHYMPCSEADDVCNDFTGWLMRNYDCYKDRPLINKICEDIWESCKEADKPSIRKTRHKP